MRSTGRVSEGPQPFKASLLPFVIIYAKPFFLSTLLEALSVNLLSSR